MSPIMVCGKTTVSAWTSGDWDGAGRDGQTRVVGTALFGGLTRVVGTALFGGLTSGGGSSGNDFVWCTERSYGRKS